MATTFGAHLEVLGASQPGAPVAVAAFSLQEGYNTGWGGTAAIVGAPQSGTMTAGDMFGALMARGVRAGRPVSLQLVVSGESLNGAEARTWPCVVEGVQPFELGGAAAACHVHLLDPVSFLAEQPIWGAYRSVSAGEIVGGALSLAAGGDGKPTLSPVLPGLPTLRVAESCRDALKTVPHAIAAGQTLGDWLAEFLALLGLRAELGMSDDGQALVLELLDSVPRRQPLNMTVVSPDEDADQAESTASASTSQSGDDPYMDPGGDPYGDPYTVPGGDPSATGAFTQPSDDGRIFVTGHAGFPGTPRRGGLIDDPTMGSARVVYALGAVGSVLTGPDLDVDEANHRVHASLLGTYAEMVMVSAISGQPRFRIGDMVTLSRPVHNLDKWQVAGVTHMLRIGAYDNHLTLLRGDIPWHPELPLHRPPVYVAGIVDGGNDFDIHEPVPRDHLGRIKVSFPFTPTPVGQEAAELFAADTTGDGRVLLEDFSDEQIASFTDDEEAWKEKVAQYEAGEFADPYPGRLDEDLSEEEKENREELRAKRKDALAYMAYEKASRDRDHDGVISDRDDLISDDLSEALKTSEARSAARSLGDEEREEAAERLEDELNSLDAEREELEAEKKVRESVQSVDVTQGFGESEDDHEVHDERMVDIEARLAEIEARKAEIANEQKLLELEEEYGELFGEDRDGLTQEALDARKDAEEAADRWPPRIPLPIITPMAGARHGFISAHRHGDICRVAVHSPLSAEIVGFQYRDDRRINVDIAGAVTGLVVEHNYSQAWSGLVFRRSDPNKNEEDVDSESQDESESGNGNDAGGGDSDAGGGDSDAGGGDSAAGGGDSDAGGGGDPDG